MTSHSPRKRPRALWTAIIILYVQTVFNVGGGVLTLAIAAEETAHNREAPGLYLFGWVSVVIGSVLLGGAILLTRGFSWARFPVAAVELLGVVSGVIAVASGIIANVVNLALCVLVLVNVFSHEVRAWFTTDASHRRQFAE
jgi:fatty acid desaturase